MPNDFYGLPFHPLIVHATVVMIPLAVLAVILAAAWPRFRGWAGPLPAGLSLVGLVLVPLSTSTGETLEKHVDMAEGLLPWMIALFVFSAIGAAVGASVQVARIGHSGAESAWEDTNMSSSARP